MDEYVVECENLVKIYKTKDIEVLALQGLDLKIERGEIMAIIGNSGSGKSTLLNMIGGLDRPSAGKLYVDGKDLFKLVEKDLVDYKRKTVGFVWQNNARNLLPFLTAAENIMMPMDFCGGSKKKERALALLDLVGLKKKSKSKLAQLSGGEQQRVAIALALVNEPRVLLADEPTGSVDVKTSDQILELFRTINKELKTTVIIVTHDMQLSKKVNRVVAIRDGKTSSEIILRQSYRDKFQNLADLSDSGEALHDEYAVLDRAGRVQIPREYLNKLGINGNKIKLEMKDGAIFMSAPSSEAES